MGEPVATEGFEEFIADDVRIFVDKKIIDEKLENNKLQIYIEGYGRYIMEIKI
jgi:hypothetical protein